MRFTWNTSVWLCASVAILLAATLAIGQDSGSRGHSHDHSSSGNEAAQRRARMESFLKKMDTNGNGVIDAEEVAGDQKPFVERMFSKAGIAPKYPMPISQILQAMTGSSGSTTGTGSSNGWNKPSGGDTKPVQSSAWGGNPVPPSPAAPAGPPPSAPPSPAGSPLGVATPPSDPAGPAATEGSPPATSGDTTLPPVEQKPARKSWRAIPARERFSGLPQWFLDKDSDGDGQVTMAEFLKNLTPAEAADFERLDLNRDGIITAAECLKAERRHGDRSDH